MGSPILRRNDREEEEDDFHHRKTFDDNVVATSTPQPSYPAAFPTSDASETLGIIIIGTEDSMPIPTSIPSQYQGRPPWFPSLGGGFHTSISTAVSSSEYPAYSGNAPSTRAPSPTMMSSAAGPISTTTSNDDASVGGATPPWEDKHGPNKVMPAAAGAAVVVLLAIIGFFVFFCLRKRKRQRQVVAQQVKVQEMKARGSVQPLMAANMGASSTFPLYATPPTHPPPSLATPPPVILGPIAPGSNGAYYTGIDTSDVVSMNDRPVVDRTGLGNPFADGDSLNEEPPPPYRPRSLAPMSRDTSFRVAPPSFTTSQTHLIGGQERSPFADPEDDDAMSDISGPTLRRDQDGMSMVSDMSYQREPVVGRPSV